VKRIAPIAKEGWPFITGPIFMGGAVMLLGWHLAGAIFFATAVALALFFRDPRRESSPVPGRVICPADGKVMSITEVEELDYLKVRSRRISIFMSLFNVHMNYAPITGRVEFLKHRGGSFHRAYLPEASLKNENNSIGIRGESHQVMVRQIAGRLARRIVCGLKENDFVQAGQKIGMIKFGSRVDVFVPLDWDVLAKEGDRVKGGLSQIARAQ
jgi:phosphatidylserine decarboxylase